eukprot:CAMPEP_0175627260 /NCGR_PEP_ID=MMETSP0096-20121207/71412_1 /TAXON_ID=311494 /ORGANISM="Alexandrium monilatum, Strain CCMP3105" /LENGTH=257 /DNA_ID=CAMNT_0016932661 /DNA_START=300 /DNA_END=1073 /DNA_ORIENTATION=-
MSWIDQSFISARNVPVKLGYLQQILRTRWLSSGGNVLPLKESLQSPEHWLSSLLDLLLSLEPQAGSRAWKRGALAGGHFGLAEFDWKVLRKAIISSRDFPVTSNCLSPQACWSCGTERVSQRCSCRSRERADLSRADGTPRSAHSLQRSSAFILSQLKSCFSSRRRSDLSERSAPQALRAEVRNRHVVPLLHLQEALQDLLLVGTTKDAPSLRLCLELLKRPQSPSLLLRQELLRGLLRLRRLSICHDEKRTATEEL